MICEYCGNEQGGSYGSGRFCSEKCARSFSTSIKREEINAKVSLALKGRMPTNGGFKKGYDPNRYNFTSEKALEWRAIRKERTKLLVETGDWNDLSVTLKKRRVFQEQDSRCKKCNLNEWIGNKITLEFHHKNGIKKDNLRNNVAYLCPNCHSQTPNDRFKNRHHTEASNRKNALAHKGEICKNMTEK